MFLLKHAPKPSEIQEGVAFFGRAGEALKKSLQRLHVDPMAVYGTNCLKFGGETFDEAAPWLDARAAHRPAEAARADGPGDGRVRERLAFPLSDPLDPAADGLQRFTATVQVLVVPDIDTALDEAPAKTAFWNAFKAVGVWYSELPPY